VSERATYTVREASERLGVSPGTLYAAIRAGELDDVVVRIGRAIRLPRARLEQLLGENAEGKENGADPP
jgi:excisionase family DNA binding protein